MDSRSRVRRSRICNYRVQMRSMCGTYTRSIHYWSQCNHGHYYMGLRTRIRNNWSGLRHRAPIACTFNPYSNDFVVVAQAVYDFGNPSFGSAAVPEWNYWDYEFVLRRKCVFSLRTKWFHCRRSIREWYHRYREHMLVRWRRWRRRRLYRHILLVHICFHFYSNRARPELLTFRIVVSAVPSSVAGDGHETTGTLSNGLVSDHL